MTLDQRRRRDPASAKRPPVVPALHRDDVLGGVEGGSVQVQVENIAGASALAVDPALSSPCGAPIMNQRPSLISAATC